jgi:hypothetical protein
LHEFEKIHKRLREFEEIEFQGKAVEVIVNSKEENSVWILSNYSASVHICGAIYFMTAGFLDRGQILSP